jgi:nickel-type superoxide dismutase maturation protease
MANRHRPKGVLSAIVAASIALAFLRWRPFRVEVEGGSMAPELEQGDWLLAVRTGSIPRGAIVVVEHPERPGFELVKRLTGVPGDTLGALVLGDDQYWVTGDRHEASTDSRWFGPVGRAAIKGAVALRYWPPSRMGLMRSASPGAATGRGRRAGSGARAAIGRSGPRRSP